VSVQYLHTFSVIYYTIQQVIQIRRQSFVVKPRNFAHSENGNVVYVNYMDSEQLKMFKVP